MTVTVISFNPADMYSGDSMLEVADLLAAAREAGKQVIALVTGMAGVTDQLMDSITQGNYRNVYTKLLAGHTSVARRMARDEAARKVLIQDVTDILDSYNWLGKSLVNRSPTPTEADNIITLGERLSARLLASNLGGRGIYATTLNASELISLGASEGDQIERIRSRLLPLLDQGYVVIITASVGINPLPKPLGDLILAACNVS